jgi:hypothetical protein
VSVTHQIILMNSDSLQNLVLVHSCSVCFQWHLCMALIVAGGLQGYFECL